MNALILAGGFGTRLYPVTKNCPKALVYVKGKPIIEHILDRIKNVDVDKIFILSNSRFYPNFAEWLKEFKKESTISKKIKILDNGVSSEDEKKGAIGDLKYFLGIEKPDDLMVLASDNLFEFELSHLAEISKNKRKSSVMLKEIGSEELIKKYSNVLLDSEKKLIFFQEKPEVPVSSICATACYSLVKKDVEKIKSNDFGNNDNIGNILELLHRESEVYGVMCTGSWMDIGSKEELQRINSEWEKLKKGA